ncbi:AMP-binding enzyme, partial [Nocardia cyriacigeorgica]|uniref:AMP-binding enzyme n=1 Tax=Nocardia cyriacigeorgica TaxID=135487 RepID=UPI0024579981
RGYWHKPEESEAALPEGRLRTGDSAIVDQQGWVYLVDRIKDQINVSGYKVWPREVEDVLYEHPAVLEAAVVGVPDDYQGESVAAYVSLKDGHNTQADELTSFARGRLAPYKRPRMVKILAELPKTQTGKIRRGALRDQHMTPEPQDKGKVNESL